MNNVPAYIDIMLILEYHLCFILHLVSFGFVDSERKTGRAVCVTLLPPSRHPQDDMQIRVFNYNTLERVHMFEAHSDYIRCIAVHPTQPYILTSSGTWYISSLPLFNPGRSD